MPDHYELLGVSPDATKDEIRDAYRAKRDALTAQESETARREVGRLNEAWQTLADPNQRGRYDAAIESGAPPDDIEVVDDAPISDAPPPRRRGLFSPPEGAQQRTLPPPTIELPPGTRFPETRTRINAMLFDLAIVILIFLAIQWLGGMLIENQYPTESDRIDAIEKQIDEQDKAHDDAMKEYDEAKEAVDDAEKDGGEATETQTAAFKASQEKVDRIEKQQDALQERYDDAYAELTGPRLLALAVGIFLGFAYLAGSSFGSGQTIGKRLRGIRVVQVETGRPSTRGAVIRYGVPAVFIGLVLNILGPVAVVVGVVGVLTWIRNNNHQGWHDRVAHTIVVEDIPAAREGSR